MWRPNRPAIGLLQNCDFKINGILVALVTGGSGAIHVKPAPYRGSKTGADQPTVDAPGSDSHGCGDRVGRVHQPQEHVEAGRAKLAVDCPADCGLRDFRVEG